jgi:hypothetical protein
MDDLAEYALVVKAFQMAVGARGYVTGYVEWDEKEARNARRNLSEFGLTPEAVREMVIDFVQGGGSISQQKETRENHPDFRFYYKIILTVAGLPRGVFVEMRLIDEDPNNPAVLIVGAHRQGA